MDKPDVITSTLVSAAEHIKLNDVSGAEKLVQKVLRVSPQHPLGLYLLSLVRISEEKWGEAEELLRFVLTQPGAAARPEVFFHYAHALYRQRKNEEALRAYRQCLLLDPAQPDALFELGELLLLTGDGAEAEKIYRSILSLDQRVAEALMGIGNALLLQGKPIEAEGIFCEALMDKGHSVSRSSIAVAIADSLKLQRRFEEALTQLDIAIAHNPSSSQAHRLQGDLLQHVGRSSEALRSYRTAVAWNPADLDAHLQLNEVLYRSDNADAFLASYKDAEALFPSSIIYPNVLGNHLLKVKRPVEAESAFRRSLRILPDNESGLAGLGRALETLGEHTGALSILQHNTRAHPLSVDAHVNLASLLLRCGDTKGALTNALRGSELSPHNQSALAILGLCYRAVGDERDGLLNDYANLVRYYDLKPPLGFSNMWDFNLELTRYLDALHNDKREYFSQTLRGGTFAFGQMFGSGHPLIDKLRQRIDEAIFDYVASLPAIERHPFIDRKSSRFGFSGSWSSCIRNSGYHVNHIHPDGWISACYYVSIPDVVHDEVQKEGWIKFGEPSEDFGDRFLMQRAVKPVPGRLVLFPSYTWHGTNAFHAPQSRTTIAFDVIPFQ